MKRDDRHLLVHVSFANVIEYCKTLLVKDFPDISRIDATYIMAKNSVIDGRKILIVLPKKSKSVKDIKERTKLRNLYI